MEPPSRGQRVGVHARRYAPFYVFGVLGLVVVLLAPTVDGNGSSSTQLGAAGGPGAQGSFDATSAADGGVAGEPGATAGGPGAVPGGGGTAGAAPTGSGAPATGGAGGAGAGTSGGAGASNDGTAVGTGTTRGGFECGPGVRQLPWSQYAAPCRPTFEGDNGGATARGVSADTIRVVVRSYATDGDANALNVVLAQAGVDRIENARRQLAFIEYFNKVFELYGRRVEIVSFQSNASPFDEANGHGREQACADATRIAEELQAFAVIPADGISFGPFTECAAASGLFQPVGAYGFPQDFYARLHPYVWGVQMNCNRINALYSEYILKRIVGRPAQYASDPVYQRQPRRLGIIQPDIEYYFPCIRQLADDLSRNGVEIVSTFDYVLDPATLPAQMNRAVVQFSADRVTSLLSVADFLTMINLTQAAARQGWGPEFVMQGSGLQDSYAFARLYEQSVVDGHLFGMSQTGDASAIYAPDGEVVRSYKEATGQDLEPPEVGNYFQLVHFFNQLQSAGPNLTPQTAADGTFTLPPSGPSLASGQWHFGVLADGSPGRQHTAVSDAREVFWDDSAPAPDGNEGDFVGTLDGRYGVGQWPPGEPTR